MVNDSMDVKWITVRGNHIPLKDGQTVQEYFAEKKQIEEEMKYKPTKHIKRSFGMRYRFEKDPNYQPKSWDQEIYFSDQALKEGLQEVVGDLDQYNFEEETNYKELSAKLLAKIKEVTSDDTATINEYIDFYNEAISPILTHKAEQFLKTMPKLKDADLEDITEGTNRQHWLECMAHLYTADSNEETNKYTSNCQRCVQAWHLRQLGYDVEAMPYEGKEGSFNIFPPGTSNRKIDNWGWSTAIYQRNTIKTVFEGKNKQWASTQFKEINDIAKNDGPGAIYQVSVSWRGLSSSHVFIVYNDNNEIKFIDPQDGKDCKHYFNPKMKTLITERTKMTRVDQAKLNGEVMKYVVGKQNQQYMYKQKGFNSRKEYEEYQTQPTWKKKGFKSEQEYKDSIENGSIEFED